MKQTISAALLFFVAIGPLAIPLTAQAGIFSRTAKVAEAEVIDSNGAGVPNSQKMNLMQPNIGPSIKKETFESKKSVQADVRIEGAALAAQVGPLGSPLDVSEKAIGGEAISTYTVRRGDTLSEIAGMFDVSVATIMAANGLSRGQALREGMVLSILPFSGTIHIVKKGETLATIAKKYKLSTSDILLANDFDIDATLEVGDELLIPDPDFDLEPAASAKSSSSGTSQIPKLPTATGLRDLGNYFLRPIAGGSVSQGLHGKNGVDIAAPKGTPILAAAEGTVTVAIFNGKYNLGYGNYVVISHPNGTQTLYAHMSEVLVTQGQSVTRGQVIGKVGRTGKATGMHLHYEIRGAINKIGYDYKYGL